MDISKEKNKLNEIMEKFNNCVSKIDTGNLSCENENLLEQSYDAELYFHNEKMIKVTKRIKEIENKLESFKDIGKNLSEMEELIVLLEKDEGDDGIYNELHNEIEKLEKDVNEFIELNLLSGELDDNNAIIKIYSTEPTYESNYFVSTLYKMLLNYAQQKNFEVIELDSTDGIDGTLANVSFIISGDYEYGHLKALNGLHKLVKISQGATQSTNRKPAFAIIEVIPELEQSDDITLNDEDLQIDTYRSSGAGGQKVNKTDSAIRITHIPTGTVVTCQNERSQTQNRETAKKVLLSRLVELKKRENQENQENIYSIDKDNVIITYSFYPTQNVLDSRTNFSTNKVEGILNGDLDGLVFAYLNYLEQLKS